MCWRAVNVYLYSTAMQGTELVYNICSNSTYLYKMIFGLKGTFSPEPHVFIVSSVNSFRHRLALVVHSINAGVVVVIISRDHIRSSMLWERFSCRLIVYLFVVRHTHTHTHTHMFSPTRLICTGRRMAHFLWRPMPMSLIACVWLSVLCNGKIVKHTFLGKSNANDRNPRPHPHARPAPPRLNKKREPNPEPRSAPLPRPFRIFLILTYN